MMAQNLTKFTVVLVILGIVLAVAIFRPPILPSLQDELSEREAEPGDRVASVQAKEIHPGEQASLLDEKENEIVEQLAAIQAERDHLAQEWEKLRAEQSRLAKGWEDLEAEQARLAQAWGDLRAVRGHLGKREDRLWEKEASLAEWEQRLQGLLRWSVGAVIVSGLLAVPSVLVLVAMMRQSGRGRTARHSGPAQVTPAPTFGDNGRDRERMAHRGRVHRSG